MLRNIAFSNHFLLFYFLDNLVITKQQSFLPLIQHDKLNFTIRDVYRNSYARGRLKSIKNCRAVLHSHDKKSRRHGTHCILILLKYF